MRSLSMKKAVIFLATRVNERLAGNAETMRLTRAISGLRVIRPKWRTLSTRRSHQYSTSCFRSARHKGVSSLRDEAFDQQINGVSFIVINHEVQ